jgi:Flp pilus assembly protein TadB
MERLTSFPWGSLTVSALSTLIAVVAIFVFGAPPWTLLPITLAGGTLHMQMRLWVERRHHR